jgi:hypothetical protein
LKYPATENRTPVPTATSVSPDVLYNFPDNRGQFIFKIEPATVDVGSKSSGIYTITHTTIDGSTYVITTAGYPANTVPSTETGACATDPLVLNNLLRPANCTSTANSGSGSGNTAGIPTSCVACPRNNACLRYLPITARVDPDYTPEQFLFRIRPSIGGTGTAGI